MSKRGNFECFLQVERLNEFNHFEGNMNIFQPAIDITQAALQKEITDIESELAAVRLFAVNAIT